MDLSLSLAFAPRSAGVTGGDGSDPLALLDANETAMRNAVVSQWASAWNPDPDAVAWDDSIDIGDETTLYNWLNGTAVSGVTRNVARNQRVQLTSPFTNNRPAINDRLRGFDWLAAGKMLLIESKTTRVLLRCRFQNSGSRGVYLRGFDIGQTVTESGGDAEWTPAANSVVITNGGTGFAPGDALILSSHANFYEMPAATVATVSGGAITGITVSDIGVLSSNATGVTATSAGGGTGAVITFNIGVNPRDTHTITIQRTGSFPLFPVMILDDISIGTGQISALPNEWLSGASAANCEQIEFRNCRFDGCQTCSVIGSVRMFKRDGSDFQSFIGDAMITTNTGVNTVIGGVAYADVWPDGIAYSWSRKSTIRNLFDNSNATTPGGKRMGLYLEHTDGGQCGTGGDTGAIYRLDEFDAGYEERATYRDSPVKVSRYSGGTQGQYNDDSTFEIRGMSHNCFYATTATATYTAWNGLTRVAYCTGVRVGNIPPSGDGTGGVTTNLDVNTGFLSRKKTGTAITSDHYIRKSVMGTIQTSAGSGYVAGNLIDAGDSVVISPIGGSAAYAAGFPSLSATDTAGGQMQYTWTDDGLESQAAFRARIYANFGKASAGMTDPANWPA